MLPTRLLRRATPRLSPTMHAASVAFIPLLGAPARAPSAPLTSSCALQGSTSLPAVATLSSAFLGSRSRASPWNTEPLQLLVTRSVRTATRRSQLIFASAQTQQDTEWNTVTVLDARPACEGHTLLTINVGITFELGSLTDAYRVPGMFVKLRPHDADARSIKPGFFAISSGPSISGVFEFLIKDGDSTTWISELKEGDTVESSPVMGKGFPIAALAQQPEDVLLFATGSGIAPIRAAIEGVLNGVDPKRRRKVVLFYGAAYPERMAYAEKFDEWAQLGVEVVPVISRPEEASSPWTGRTGYVQHALEDIGVEEPGNTAALLCGLRGMTDEVKAMLLESGVPESNVMFNF